MCTPVRWVKELWQETERLAIHVYVKGPKGQCQFFSKASIHDIIFHYPLSRSGTVINGKIPCQSLCVLADLM